jgi:hypothetical protein
MDNNIFLFAIRGTERIAVVALAGLLIYLGYKLFLQIPDKTDSEGKVVLPGGVSIYLTRIGPGAFLALFGAAILIYSVTTQMEINPPRDHQDSTNVNQDSTDIKIDIASIKYAQETALLNNLNQEMLDYEDKYLEMDFQTLNRLSRIVDDLIETGAKGNIDFDLASKLKTGIVRLKGMVMLRHWKDEWGNSKVFYNWVKTGTKEDVPPEIKSAVKFFNAI